MIWTSLNTNFTNFFVSAAHVPGGIIIHTNTVLDGPNRISSSEAIVFVPCNLEEASEFIKSHQKGRLDTND